MVIIILLISIIICFIWGIKIGLIFLTNDMWNNNRLNSEEAMYFQSSEYIISSIKRVFKDEK